MEKKILLILIFFAFVNLSCTQSEQSVVLTCSGKESKFDLLTFQTQEKSFSNVVIKIRKKGSEILVVTVDDVELTKEQRVTNSSSANFLRWFEQTSDGITTFGKNTTDKQAPAWNIKLSNAGVFERDGIGITQKGTCIPLQKAF